MNESPGLKIRLRPLSLARISTYFLIIFTIILANILPGLQASAADWSQYLYDPSHSSNQSGETTLSPANATSITKLWSFKAGGNVASTPTVVGNTAYVGSWDGYEYALDATTGALRWKAYLGLTDYVNCTAGEPENLGVYSSANVQNGIVYVGGGDSYWYALNAIDGSVISKVYTGDSTSNGGNYNWASTITATIGGTPYAFVGVASNCDVPLVPGKVIKINLTNYSVAGVTNLVPIDYSVGGGVWTSPAYDAATGLIYVTTGTPGNPDTQPESRAIVSINATTMAVVDHWQIPDSEGLSADPDWGTSPVLYSKNSDPSVKMVIANHKNGYMYAFNRANLAAGYLWKTQLGIGGDGPTAGQGSVSTPAYGYDSATGSNALFAAAGTTPVGAPNTYRGTVNAIDPDTGHIIWTIGEDNPVIPAITYTNGLVLGVAGTKLDIINAATGTSITKLALPQSSYSPASVSNGQIYVGAGDGTIAAYGIPNPTTACPTQWSCSDINTGTQIGSQTFNAGTVSVTAGGDISSPSDSFRYVYQMTKGDGVVSANVVSQTQPASSPSAKAGVMMRTSSDPAAPYFGVFSTPSGGVQIQYRTIQGGSTNSYTTSVTGQPYLKIERVSGGTFLPESSVDGITWTPIGSRSVTLTGALATTSSLLSGVAVTSHNTTSLNTATFDHLITESIPTGCAAGWSCTDVGAPGLTGGQFSNGAWTIWGGGSDIYGTSDQFHFVYQPLAGNGDLATQITSQLNSSSYAKAGVMMRADTTTGSAYYGALLTPANGLLIQYRNASGAITNDVTPVGSVSAPLYVRVGRSGPSFDVFTTYTSSDGVTWTPVANSAKTIPALAGTLDAGLAVSSHSAQNLGEATIKTLSLSCHVDWTCVGVNETINQIAGTADTSTDLNSWVVQGSGGDIWSTADSFHYDYQNLNGDGGVSAQITSQSETNQYAKAGVMIRDSSASNSAFYDLVAVKDHDFEIQYRSTTGGSASTVYSNIPTTYPYYLKIVRSGSLYSGYVSTDGVTWRLIPNSTVTIQNGPTGIRSAAALAGIAITAHDSYKVGTATLANVSVFTNNSCETGWTCEDISNNGQIGVLTSYDAVTNTWTTQGSGSDIWSLQDHFHYNDTPLSGSGGISTHLVSQTGGSDYAKAGVMIRDSNSPSAAFYDVVATAQHGIDVQWRTSSNGTTAATGIDTGISPASSPYLKVLRSGTTYSAYTSTNGTTWTLIPNSTVVIDSSATGIRSVSALRGNAVTSHDTSSISTAVFGSNTLY